MNETALASVVVVSVAACWLGWRKGTRDIERAAASHGLDDREPISGEMLRRRVLLALAFGVFSAFAWYLVLLLMTPGEY